MKIENILKGAVISVIGGLIVKGVIDKTREYRESILEIECKDLGTEDISDDE